MLTAAIAIPALVWILHGPAVIPAAVAPDGRIGQRTSQPDEEPRQTEVAAAAPRPPRPRYVPSRRGAPVLRIPAGQRGAAHASLTALAPAHVADTLSAQPEFFWHLDAVPERPLQLLFTLVRPDQIDPVAEHRLGGPGQPGVHRVRLADLDASLEPGVDYQWAVSLVDELGIPEPAHVAMGWVRRVAVPGSLTPTSPVAELAESGLWYDALARLQAGIESGPSPERSRADRDALLEQVSVRLSRDRQLRSRP